MWTMGTNGPQRRLLELLATVALMAFLLTGCGASGAVGGDSSGSGSTPTPSPCAGSRSGKVPSSVTLRAADENHTTPVPVGAVVEIQLDSQHVWRLGSVAAADALTPIGLQGALDQGACVWEFQVAQPGDAVVTFVGTALCPPNTMCPQYAIVARFTIQGV